MPQAKVAYSYIRFSTPEQAEGDSFRRQTELARRWCEANGVKLDTATTLLDLGRSAYKGRHRTDDKAALAGFLKLVEAGKVPRGSHLLIENLDRLSREEEVPACHLLTGILMAGVRVVQLSPAELALTDKSNGFDIMRAVMELSRGHGESKVKSDRVAAAWEAKRRKCRESGAVATGRLPAWVEKAGNKLALIPARAAVVRRIFSLAASGYGIKAIVGRLTRERVPAFVVPRTVKKAPPSGRSSYKGAWTRSYIATILADRRALGEYQPTRAGKPEGDPLPNYYPPVVGAAELRAAAAGAAQRKRHPGQPRGGGVYLFSGLLRHARGGDPFYVVANRNGPKGNRPRQLMNANGIESRSRSYCFPLETFERAILSQLAEVDPREVIGKGDGAPDLEAVLAAEQARVRARIAELEAELLVGDVPALAKALRTLAARDKELGAELEEVRQRAACPLSESWAEAKSLLAALDSAKDQQDARLRLRSAIRHIVREVWLLIVGRGRDRLCAAQIYFADGKHARNYLILHRPPKANKAARTEGGWWCRSLAAVVKAGDLDLRRPEDAAALEELLNALDLDVMVGEPPAKVARRRRRAV
jgi:DNA invertase Pin-like site-specific DNA recombinase